jgi:hypothetical protein
VAAPAADHDNEELEMPLVKGFIGSRRKEIKKSEKGKFTKKTLTLDMSPSDWFSVPCHRLQLGPIVRIAVNMAKNDSQWTLQATDAIVVDFCDFKKSGSFTKKKW